MCIAITVKPLIKDTPKEDKPPNNGQAESTLVYTLYRKSPLKEDNLSTKDKTAGPEIVLFKRFHCTTVLTSQRTYILCIVDDGEVDSVVQGGAHPLSRTGASEGRYPFLAAE